MSRYKLYHITYQEDIDGPSQAVLVEATCADQAIYLFHQARGWYFMCAIALARPEDITPDKPILRSKSREAENEQE